MSRGRLCAYRYRVILRNGDGMQYHERSSAVTGGGSADALQKAHAPRLLDQVRACCCVRHYSLRTERAYIGWIRRFIPANGKATRTTWDAQAARSADPHEKARYASEVPNRQTGIRCANNQGRKNRAVAVNYQPRS